MSNICQRLGFFCKWQNFAKSGHAAKDVVELKLQLDLSFETFFRIFAENGIDFFDDEFVNLLGRTPDERLGLQQLKSFDKCFRKIKQLFFLRGIETLCENKK